MDGDGQNVDPHDHDSVWEELVKEVMESYHPELTCYLETIGAVQLKDIVSIAERFDNAHMKLAKAKKNKYPRSEQTPTTP